MSVSSHINYSLVTSRKEPFVCRLSQIKSKAARLWDTSHKLLLSLRSFSHTMGVITVSSRQAHGTAFTLNALTIQRSWYCFKYVQKLIWRSHMTFAPNIISKNTSATLVAPWCQCDRWFEQTHLKTGTEWTVSWSWADREALPNSYRLSKNGWRMLRDYSREQHRHRLPP